jgi:hypothetical protein
VTETAESGDSLVDQLLQGRAPERIRAAAARGALPLPRPVLVRLYIHLRDDADESIRQAAEASLSGLGSPEIQQTLADSTCSPEVLTFFAKRATREEALAERIAFHPAVPAAALARLAASGNAAVVELVLTNQERLLATPGLLDQMMLNPALRVDQRGRILELLDRAARQAERRRAGAPAGASEGVEAQFVSDDVEAVARLLEVDVGELLSRSEIVDGEEFELSEQPEVRLAYQQILTLNSAQKAILAMKGGREERMILVRDTNRIVASGVLRNPRITEAEVEVIAKMRNVSDEVLRQIGTNREWAKNYEVALALVTNPRTPQAISTNFVGRLNNRHLKNLHLSRDVPELIRRMAQRTLATRTQAQAGKLRTKK